SMAASAQTLQKRSSAGLLLQLWHSSLGKKYVMAVTGLGLYLFVIIHMLGNLQIFLGAEALNAYAALLKSNPGVLWGARIGLLAIVALHITSALQLASINRKARPVGYATGKPVASTFAQRTILASGLIILAFILFHLAHYTLGLVDPSFLDLHDEIGRHDVYGMVRQGFSNPLVSVFYIVAMGLLLLHLSHGVSSLFQSLGLRSKKTVGVFDKLAKGSALLLFIGNSAIVIAVLFGLIK
ncbi:MAG: succinate dehydrogenase cytochrome b subunit, partial [Acidobacteriota bacterium]